MITANGATLQAALPIYRGHAQPDHWVVMVKWHDQYITAVMGSLDDSSWYWGHYFNQCAPAMADAYLRANIHGITRESLEECASMDRAS